MSASNRRAALLRLAGLGLPAALASTPIHSAARDQTPVARLATDALRRGGVVAALRHAQAPGIFDPPGMLLSDCASQRGLDDEGRAQARRLGQWFKAHALRPTVVRSSPWCRCLDTARLAFGLTRGWPELGSPSGLGEPERAARGHALRAALQALPKDGFEVWVTHQFVLHDLTGLAAASGAGWVLRWDGHAVQVVAPIDAT